MARSRCRRAYHQDQGPRGLDPVPGTAGDTIRLLGQAMLSHELLEDMGVLVAGPASIAPHVANHFVSAEVKHFAFRDREAAIAWLCKA